MAAIDRLDAAFDARWRPATLDEFEQTYARPIIFAACLYESAAIGSRRLPTITEWVKRLNRTSVGQCVLWLVWGWLTAHFFRAVVHEETP